MKKTFRLVTPLARATALEAVRTAQDGSIVQIGPETRSSPQNARLWASLTDIAEQVVWHGKRLDQASWKCVFIASLRRLEVVPNLEGTGFVALGSSSSKMSKQEFSDLLELINAFGAQHDVKFKEAL